MTTTATKPTVNKMAKNGNGNTPTSNKTKSEDAPEVVVSETTSDDNLVVNEVKSQEASKPHPEGTSAVRKPINPKSALDFGLTIAIKAYMGLQQEIAKADKVRVQARAIMVRMGIEIPNDGVEDTVAPAPATVKKAGRGRPPAATKTQTPASASTPTSGTLWSMVENYLFTNNFVEPNYDEGKNINDYAKKNGFSTAANLLAQKLKTGELVKGERGEYALPRGYKRK